MSEEKRRVPDPVRRREVDAFLRQVAALPKRRPSGRRGRLIFALDATASREPTWDQACQIQGEMFLAAAALGGLSVELVYYRGFGEFRATPWVESSTALVRHMSGVFCRSGQTQIARVLAHALRQAEKAPVNALVFVGDCMEESADLLLGLAGKLALRAVPVFVFHEGGDPVAGQTFRDIARVSGGAYCRFDSRSAQQLRELLGAVAAYAAGGRGALEAYSERSGEGVRLLTRQLR